MSSESFWGAIALLLVIEGLLPFVSPGSWRRAFNQLLTLRDGQLRFFGLCRSSCFPSTNSPYRLIGDYDPCELLWGHFVEAGL